MRAAAVLALALALVAGSSAEVAATHPAADHGEAMAAGSAAAAGEVAPTEEHHFHGEGGMDIYGHLHDMFDDESGGFWTFGHKDLHPWTFDEWKSHREAAGSTVDEDPVAAREKYAKFHAKHEEEHQKALERHEASALWSTFAHSRVGSWMITIFLLCTLGFLVWCIRFLSVSKVCVPCCW